VRTWTGNFLVGQKKEKGYVNEDNLNTSTLGSTCSNIEKKLIVKRAA
jgi:hypothetical protein